MWCGVSDHKIVNIQHGIGPLLGNFEALAFNPQPESWAPFGARHVLEKRDRVDVYLKNRGQ
jgi:hypothetical protein